MDFFLFAFLFLLILFLLRVSCQSNCCFFFLLTAFKIISWIASQHQLYYYVNRYWFFFKLFLLEICEAFWIHGLAYSISLQTFSVIFSLNKTAVPFSFYSYFGTSILFILSFYTISLYKSCFLFHIFHS